MNQKNGISLSGNNASHDYILILSENSSGASELSQLLAEKGYQSCKAPLLADLKCLDRRHPLLIVILDCHDTCVSIAEHLRLHSEMSDIPIICMNDRHCIGKSANIENICIGEFLPKSSAVEVLESRIRFCLHKQTLDAKMLSGGHSHERRYFERRQSIHLIEQTQTAHQEPGIAPPSMADAPSHAQANINLINLLVISQREHLFGKLLTQFRKTPAISIAQECFNSLELIADRLEHLHPDVLLVDTALSTPALTEWLHVIRKKDAKVKIILLHDDEIPDLVNEIVEFGISGLIKINASREVYIKAIQAVHTGELWLPHVLICQIIANFSSQRKPLSRHTPIDLPNIITTSSLTQRELRVIELVAQGLTNKQIAKLMNISPETVKKKLANVFDKSGVRSRSQIGSIYAAILKGTSSQNQD
jgi:DNA-binding NarL/FixJ family response regulator